MAGTLAGGRQASMTNKKKYGEDFYKKIGSLGGKASNTGGFYGNPELAKKAGKLGGTISRRGKATKKPAGRIMDKSIRNEDKFLTFEELPSAPSVRIKMQ